MDDEKFMTWRKLRGTPQMMAKRRYITFLSEISPSLIDVMPDEKPPDGFPLDRSGHVICAKCNTTVGCARPLLDNHNTDLRQQLFERDELHEPEALKDWVRNALKTQRCIWGLHMPITKAQSKEFIHWFEKPDNKGFSAYDSSTLMQMIRELIVYHYEVAYDMMQNKTEYSVEDYNDQATRAIKLREVYMQLSGEIFIFEVPCARNSHMCNEQRLADGGKNHTHPVEIDPPNRMDVASFKEAIELRTQCQQLGLSPMTGVCTDIEKRCAIYRERLAEHFKAVEKAAAAKKRNEARTQIHAAEKQRVVDLSTDMIVRQLWDAFHTNRPDRVVILIKRGGDPNEESPRGLTPLLCLILCECAVEEVEELVLLKADINKVNKYGVTPLMLACKLKLTKIVHMLMRVGASVMQTAGKIAKRVTALHWCALLGCEEEAKIMVDHVRDSAGDALRVARFLDAPTDDGETALMVAAVTRNGVMARLLVSLGASTGARNKQGRTAAYIARHHGWTELADWLDTKLGSGVARIESFSDINYDKKIRYGTIKLRDLLLDFGKNYLVLVQKRTGKHPLMPPSIIQQYISEEGSGLLDKYHKFINRHALLVNEKDEYNRDCPREDSNPAVQLYKTMRASVAEMVDYVSKGMCSPNYDCPTNPMSVTPLICAAMFGDVRSMKLLVREGAEIDGPNRYGATPLMFAAQLHNIESCIELLTQGASLSKQDHYGFTPLAYANSLPLPTAMQRRCVDVLLNDDVDGTRPLNAADILKTAAESGVDGLKAMVAQNAEESHPDTIAMHHRILRLLEQYGLSHMESEHHAAIATYTTQWRIKPEEQEEKKDEDDDGSDSTSKATPKGDGLGLDDDDEENDYNLRCPMCTLMLPCAHFFKGAVLRRYFKRLKEQQEAAAKGLTGSALDATNTNTHKRKKSPMKMQGIKVRDKNKEILEETGLADRGTDRSLTLATTYRGRELQIMREAEAKEAARLEAEQKAKLKAYAIAKGVWVEWKEYYDANGALVFEHQETGETWIRYFDRHSNPYYYNAATSESRWIAPNKKPVTPPAPSSPIKEKPDDKDKGKPKDKSKDKAKDKKPVAVAPPVTSMALVIPDSRPNSQQAQQQDSRPVSADGFLLTTSASSESSGSSGSSGPTTAGLTRLDTISTVGSPASGPPSGVMLIANSPHTYPKDGDSSAAAAAAVPSTAVNAHAIQGSLPRTDSTGSLTLLESPAAIIKANTSMKRNVFTPDISQDPFASVSTLDSMASMPKSILKMNTDGSLTGPKDRTKNRKSVHFNLPGDGGQPVGMDSVGDINKIEPFSKPSTPAASVTNQVPILLDLPKKTSSGKSDSGKSSAREVEEILSARSLASQGTVVAPVAKPALTPLEALMMDDDDDVTATVVVPATSQAPSQAQSQVLRSAASSASPDSTALVVATTPPPSAPGTSSSELSSTSSPPKAPAAVVRRAPISKTDLVGENPVPVSSRRVLLFTSDIADYGGEWDAVSASHHFSASPITHTLPKLNLTSTEAETAINSGIANEANSEATAGDSDGDLESMKLPPIYLSGWLFVGLSVSKPGPPPIEPVKISLTTWAGIIEHLRTKFSEHWLPHMRLEPAVDLTRAEPRVSKRCTVCQTGFARIIIDDSELGEGGKDKGAAAEEAGAESALCLQCLMRRDMYEMVKPSLPASYRARNPTIWPFDERAIKKITEASLIRKQYLAPSGKATSGKATSGKAGIGGGGKASSGKASTTNDDGKDAGSSTVTAAPLTSSPSNSGKSTIEALLAAAVAKSSSGKSNSGKSNSGKGDSGKGIAFTNSPSMESPRRSPRNDFMNLSTSPMKGPMNMSPLALPSSPLAHNQDAKMSPSKAWRKKITHAAQDGDSASSKSVGDVPPKSSRWDGAVDWFNKFEELKESDDETQFALGRGAGVRDLPLLPYLVAKGHVEDLERAVRSCYGQAGEEDSLQILPRLLCMQAEACKLLGLWPLALALFLDRADMLATLTGYENIATIGAICHVTSCLRKMGMGHLAKSYLRAIVRKLEGKYENQLHISDNAHFWRELGKDIMIADE
jgi:ankyrin repeat protein